MSQSVAETEQETTSHREPVVYILHDSEAWVAPLRHALDARGTRHVSWNLREGLIPLHEAPPRGIFYNRIGASAHVRDAGDAPALAREILGWLERGGRRVINGSHALKLELSKTAQHLALEVSGIAVPRTIPTVGDSHVLDAVAAFAGRPVILKHNRGGTGHGVTRLDSLEEAREHLADPACPRPIDGVWLVQELIASARPEVFRLELVGGRFLYAMRVRTDSGFALCPAEVCALPGPNRYALTDALDGAPIIARLERFLTVSHIEIAGIELIRARDGRLVVFDVNTNTNYNEAAERTAGGPSGMAAVARYLTDQLRITRRRAA